MLHQLPAVNRLRLAEVTLPEGHPPLPDGRDGYRIFSYLIDHPDGPLLVDTGVGMGNDLIDEVYNPKVTPIEDALTKHGVRVEDVTAIVNTHLHYDHCGQNHSLDAPVYVQQAEVEAARKPGYTVPEWAAIPPGRLREIDGDATIADGVKVLATPGHTPGHQSVLIESQAGCAVIAGQAVFWAGEWEDRRVSELNAEDTSAGQPSLERLQALQPLAVYFSHDDTVVRMATGGGGQEASQGAR